MRRDTTQSAENLNRPEGNSLLENYDVHDVGEEYVIQRLEDMGFRVEAWGMDKRHDSGNGLLYEDDKVDLRCYDGDELVLQVEVKTKSAAHYMGSLNKRHLEKYDRLRQNTGVPTYIAWCEVDDDSVVDTFVTPVSMERVAEEFQFPDGNKGVRISIFSRFSWGTIETFITP